jgi:hypothetical protein
MPAVATVTDQVSIGNLTERRGTLNLGLYATSGVAVPPSVLGFSSVSQNTLDLPSIILNGAVPIWLVVTAAGKVMAFDKTGTELANATDLSAVVVPFSIRGLV